jgi:anti-sigma-K factor RskA
MSSVEEQFDCAECVDAAPYVLGALADPNAYREHLATCAICQAEVAKLQPVADTLPAAVPSERAPEAMRQRVLATVRSEAELLSAAGHQADQAPPRSSPRRSRRGWLAGTLALAASAAVAVVLLLAVSSTTRERVTSAHVAVPGAGASLLQLGAHSELLVSRMPQPPRGKIYEVWLNRGGASPQPTDSLFGVTNAGSGAVAVPNNLRGVKEVLVTSEPLGGSSRPTSAPLIRITLSA